MNKSLIGLIALFSLEFFINSQKSLTYFEKSSTELSFPIPSNFEKTKTDSALFDKQTCIKNYNHFFSLRFIYKIKITTNLSTTTSSLASAEKLLEKIKQKYEDTSLNLDLAVKLNVPELSELIDTGDQKWHEYTHLAETAENLQWHLSNNSNNHAPFQIVLDAYLYGKPYDTKSEKVFSDFKELLKNKTLDFFKKVIE